MKTLVLSLVGMASVLLGAESVFQGRLRAYGKTRATQIAPGVLRIDAESSEKAALWQAKWLSDLTNTLGTVVSVSKDVWQTPAGVCLAGIREGRRFTIISAPNGIELASRRQSAGVGESETPVPLPCWMNGLEQYPFRFYYRPGAVKGGVIGKDNPPYDPTWEFDYAAKNGHLGFVFWTEPAWSDWAWGMHDDGEWMWARNLAASRGVPVVLNTMIDAKAQLLYPDEWMCRAPGTLAGTVRHLEPKYVGQQIAWSSMRWRKEAHRNTQNRIRAYNTDYVLDILQPDGELAHFTPNELLEYGPVADASFRDYLRETVSSDLSVVAKYLTGNQDAYSSWEEIRLPEAAEFAGWDPTEKRSIALGGTWRRILRKPLLKEFTPKITGQGVEAAFAGKNAKADSFAPYPKGWMQPAFDDRDAQVIERMPGSEALLYLTKQPAGLRLRFTLNEVPEGRVWLHVWDLNSVWHYTYGAWMNGYEVYREPGRFNSRHRGMGEVTGLLRKGENLLALDLPFGMVGYRCYLTTEPPRVYPDTMDRAFNARWAVFCGWQSWVRKRAVEMGVRAIRAIEPDKPIIQMAPHRYVTDIKEIARKYGTRFHDTGSMGAFYSDWLPGQMRSMGAPFSLEPGGPAKDLNGFRRIMALWIAEGVNAIHYFIHAGDILWNPEIKAEFERMMPLIHRLGQKRQMRAPIAFLEDTEVRILDEFPSTPVIRPRGWESLWTAFQFVFSAWETDHITPGDFSAGIAQKYPVIIDLNTSVMSMKLAREIEAYVRNGGTFISLWRTAWHTPDRAAAHPLAKAAGCAAEQWSVYDPKTGDVLPAMKNGGIRSSAGVTFDRDFVKTCGARDGQRDGCRLWLTIPQDDPSLTILARWADGGAAAVERRLDNGRFVTIGYRIATYNGHELIPYLLRAKARKRLLQVASDSTGARSLRPRAWVSGNGLYDLFCLLAPETGGKKVPYQLSFADGGTRAPVDLLTGKPFALSGTLDDHGFVAGYAPRQGAADDAGSVWFEKEKGEWIGAVDIPAEEWRVSEGSGLVQYDRYRLDLDDGWEITTLDGAERDPQKLDQMYKTVTPESWEKKPATAWKRARLTGLVEGVNLHGSLLVARRTFTVPSAWNDGGDVGLWVTAMYSHNITIGGAVKYYLNGRLLQDKEAKGLCEMRIPVKPGETAELVMVIRNRHVVIRGVKANVYLTRIPKAARNISLEGEWEVRPEVITDPPVVCAVPCQDKVAGKLWTRTFELTDAMMPKEGEQAFLNVMGAEGYLYGAVVNGRFAHKHHHRHGARLYLNITPYLHRGENRIMLVTSGWQIANPIDTVKIDIR